MSGSRRAIRGSYDRLAGAYAENLYGELAGKPLDRHLLDRFAEEVSGQAGPVADVGCGPGQVGRYLRGWGLRVLGVDLSLAMLCQARRRDPRGTGLLASDLLGLGLREAALSGIVAFYAIVHLDDGGLVPAFRELRRVLAPGGVLLLAFHVGSEVVHRDELWGESVDLDFRFFSVEAVTRALERAGIPAIELSEREPYPGAEHPSRRAYLLARRAG